ncbi:hypothetical protein ACP275_05G092700 [Erythranthe tilingii]
MYEFYILAFFSVSILLMSIFWHIKFLQGKAPPLPPGPRGLPILGYLPFLIGKNLVNEFTFLGHKYGPIFKLDLGNKLCVVISSPSFVKEVVREKDGVFSHRDTPIAALIASYGGNDIVFSEPILNWRAMRKIFVQEMMSKKCLEESRVLRKDHVRKAIRQVHNDVGKPIQIGQLAFRTELHVIMNMLWGGTITGEGGKIFETEFCGVLSKLIDLMGKPNIFDFFPILAWLDIQGVRKQAETYMKSVDMIFELVIAQHKNMLCGEVTCKKQGKKDFLQILLEIQKKQDSEMPISQKQIKAILQVTNYFTNLMSYINSITCTNLPTLEPVELSMWAIVGC